MTNLDPWSMDRWIVYTYFPTSRERDLSDFLPVGKLTYLMQETGFYNIRVRNEHNHSEESLSDFLKYASHRHRTSQMIAIQDEDYEAGIANLNSDITKSGNDSRISSEICLVRVTADKPK